MPTLDSIHDLQDLLKSQGYKYILLTLNNDKKLGIKTNSFIYLTKKEKNAGIALLENVLVELKNNENSKETKN